MSCTGSVAVAALPVHDNNKRLLCQKTDGACLYMPQDGHWRASCSCEVIPPQKLVFPRPNKNDENSPRTGNGMRTPTFKKKSQIHFFLSSSSAVLVRNSVTPMSTLANNDKRSCSSQKRGKFQPKMIAFFLCFPAKNLLARFCHAVLDFREHQGLPPD